MASSKPKIVYWKPGMVVRGKRVYLDANFLVGLANSEHIWNTSATLLLASFKERGTILVLSSLAFNEAIYQLSRLSEDDWYEHLIINLLSYINLSFFEPPDAAFNLDLIRVIREFKLDPTDAFHYCAARKIGCPLVTNDVGFQKIADQSLTLVTFF